MMNEDAIAPGWKISTAVAFADTPNWLLQQKNAAVEQLQTKSLPTLRDEAWRYTNMKGVHSTDFVRETVEQMSINEPLGESADARLVFIDGTLQNSLSRLIDGMTIGSVTQLSKTHQKDIQPHFGSTFDKHAQSYQYLNTALFDDGYAIILPESMPFEPTIEICFIASQQHSQPQWWHTRNIIIAKAHSQAQIIERHISAQRDNSVSYLNNTLTEIFCEPGAKVTHYKVNQEAPNAIHIGAVFSRQQANSSVHNQQFQLSQALTRNEVICQLDGQGADLHLYGLVIGENSAHIDNYTAVCHNVPDCQSNQHYKSLLDNRSQGAFRACVFVAQDAQNTNAQQQNNNVLLSNQAQANSKPQLEIYADDVLCSHGATVGKLDESALFYLQSRGIDKVRAKALLTNAFVDEVVQKIRVSTLKTQIQEWLEAHFQK